MQTTPTSAKVPKSGKVQQGSEHLSRPSDACQDAQPIYQFLINCLYSSRKAFLESFHLMAALRGITRPALPSMKTDGKIISASSSCYLSSLTVLSTITRTLRHSSNSCTTSSPSSSSVSPSSSPSSSSSLSSSSSSIMSSSSSVVSSSLLDLNCSFSFLKSRSSSSSRSSSRQHISVRMLLCPTPPP